MAELTPLLVSWRFAFPLGLGVGAALLLGLLVLPTLPRQRGLALDLGYWATQVDLRSNGLWAITSLVVVASLVMACALGNPEVVARERVLVHGKPVMAVVDVSGSMDYRARIRPASPGQPVQEERSNIEKARAIFADVLNRDLGVDYGLLLYSTEQYIARYFAFNKSLLRDTLENDEEISFISTGTRTAAALAVARRFLTQNVPVGDKAILLISDMQGDLEAMVAMAEEMENCQHAGIKVFGVIIGPDNPMATNKAVPPPEVEGVMMVDMNDKAGMERLCQELAAMRDAPVGSEETPVRKNVTSWLALVALLLAMLCLLLSEGRFRKMP